MEQTIEVENIEDERGWRDRLRTLRTVPKNAVLAYAGFWGMAYDEAQDIVKRSRDVLTRAEDRGETLGSGTRERVRTVVEKVQRRAEEAQEEVEEQAEEVVAQVNLATRAEVAALDKKVDTLSKQVGALLAKLDQIVLAQQEPAVELPLVGYDELTAKEVVALLNSLTIPQLLVLRDYEMAHDNRVTVLREIDMRASRMPIPGYDELPVEEIEPLLPALEAAQLDYLARYEANHENRVTVLRAIERVQQSRVERAD